MYNLLKYVGLMVIGLVFLAFGIQILVAAFSLKDPFTFVLTFFASNFIILISAALMIGFTLKLLHQRKTERINLSADPLKPLTDENQLEANSGQRISDQ